MMSSPPFGASPNHTASSKEASPSPVAIGSLLASVKLASESPSPAAISTPTPTSKDRSLPSQYPFVSPLASAKARPPMIQSLSAKRARQVPGTLDLSSLPQFPLHPSSSTLHLTPHGSELSGSTPRAVAERPGLFSRWSSDSEITSSCTSSDCESCDEEEVREDGEAVPEVAPEQESNGETLEEQEGADDEGTSKRPPVGKRSITMKRLIPVPNPFFLAPSVAYDPIASPLPVSSPGGLSSLLPPAPKPHQHGFSPYAEEQGFTFTGPTASVSSPLAHLSPSSPSPSSPSRRKKRSHHHHKHRQGKQGQSASDDGFHDSSDSSMGSPCSEGSSGAPLPRLTRSQGLRIKDQGDRPRGRYARALSQQLKHTSSSPSSPIKTATALLGGTISPAESTTDLLRVKLREMPGAKTPDGSAPPSPSPASATSRHHLRPTTARSLSSPKLRAASPLHVTSFPGEGAKDTKLNVFNSAFSFANRESPARSPLALKSPRSPMSTIKEHQPDSNPYFAGYA